MRRFTLKATYPEIGQKDFFVYIEFPHLEFHPLRFQTLWLKQVREGTIIKEVSESLRKLKTIAYNDQVNFADLCTYALGTAKGPTADKPASDAKVIDIAGFIEKNKEAKKPKRPVWKNTVRSYWDDNSITKEKALSAIVERVFTSVKHTSKTSATLLHFFLSCEPAILSEFIADIDGNAQKPTDIAYNIAVVADCYGSRIDVRILEQLNIFLKKPLGEQLLALCDMREALEEWAMLPATFISSKSPLNLTKMHKDLQEYFALQQWHKKHEPTAEECYEHANVLFEGKHGKPAALAAFSWYRKSAKLGFAKAERALAWYFDDCGDHKRYRFWLDKAIKQNDPKALYFRGFDYLNGTKDTPQNDKLALSQFKKAYKLGCAEAANSIGLYYLKMKKPDYKNARSWFIKAISESQDEYSYYNLGEIYEKGLGVTISIAQALEYYSAAAENGHEKAKLVIKRLQEKG